MEAVETVPKKSQGIGMIMLINPSISIFFYHDISLQNILYIAATFFRDNMDECIENEVSDSCERGFNENGDESDSEDSQEQMGDRFHDPVIISIHRHVFIV